MAKPKKKKIQKTTTLQKKQTALSTKSSNRQRSGAVKAPLKDTGKTKQEHEQDKIKKIKRVNERRTEIERAVANKSLPKEFLDQFEAAMRSAVHDNKLFSAKGNISHSKNALGKINEQALDALLQKQTAGQAKKTTYKQYKAYIKEQERTQKTIWERVEEGEDVDPNEYTPAGYSYDDYLADRDYVYDNMESDPDWYNSMKAAFQGIKGKKSYAQLRAANEKWRDATAEQQQQMMQAAVERQQAAYWS